MGDNGRILEYIGSHPRVHNYPRIATASFSSDPAVQELTRFLDASSVSGAESPGVFRLCIPTRSVSTRHGDHPCYGSVCSVCQGSTRKQSMRFGRPEVHISTLGLPSLASSKSMERCAPQFIQGFLGSSSPLLDRSSMVFEGAAVLPRYFIPRTKNCKGTSQDFHVNSLKLSILCNMPC